MSLLDRKPFSYVWGPLYRRVLSPIFFAVQGTIHRRLLERLAEIETSNERRYTALRDSFEARANTLQALAEHQTALIEHQQRMLGQQQAGIDIILTQIRANEQTWAAVEDILLAVYRQPNGAHDSKN